MNELKTISHWAITLTVEVLMLHRNRNLLSYNTNGAETLKKKEHSFPLNHNSLTFLHVLEVTRPSA